MKTLQDAVKNGARLSDGDRWLVYTAGEWIVYSRTYGQKKTREVCRVEESQEEVAVQSLFRE